MTFNQVVRGSRPRRPTTFLTDIISKKWVPQNYLTPKTLRTFADKLVFADKIERRDMEKLKPYPTRDSIFINQKNGLMYERLISDWHNRLLGQ